MRPPPWQISLEAARDQATQAAAEMGHRAAHDELTGLLNRSGFMQAVASLPSSSMTGVRAHAARS